MSKAYYGTWHIRELTFAGCLYNNHHGGSPDGKPSMMTATHSISVKQDFRNPPDTIWLRFYERKRRNYRRMPSFNPKRKVSRPGPALRYRDSNPQKNPS